MKAAECKKAGCEYVVYKDNDYYCADCKMNVSNVWSCGIIEEWYIQKEKDKENV